MEPISSTAVLLYIEISLPCIFCFSILNRIILNQILTDTACVRIVLCLAGVKITHSHHLIIGKLEIADMHGSCRDKCSTEKKRPLLSAGTCSGRKSTTMYSLSRSCLIKSSLISYHTTSLFQLTGLHISLPTGEKLYASVIVIGSSPSKLLLQITMTTFPESSSPL